MRDQRVWGRRGRGIRVLYVPVAEAELQRYEDGDEQAEAKEATPDA